MHDSRNHDIYMNFGKEVVLFSLEKTQELKSSNIYKDTSRSEDVVNNTTSELSLFGRVESAVTISQNSKNSTSVNRNLSKNSSVTSEISESFNITTNSNSSSYRKLAKSDHSSLHSKATYFSFSKHSESSDSNEKTYIIKETKDSDINKIDLEPNTYVRQSILSRRNHIDTIDIVYNETPRLQNDSNYHLPESPSFDEPWKQNKLFYKEEKKYRQDLVGNINDLIDEYKKEIIKARTSIFNNPSLTGLSCQDSYYSCKNIEQTGYKKDCNTICPQKCQENIEKWKKIQLDPDRFSHHSGFVYSPTYDGIYNLRFGLLTALVYSLVTFRYFGYKEFRNVKQMFDVNFYTFDYKVTSVQMTPMYYGYQLYQTAKKENIFEMSKNKTILLIVNHPLLYYHMHNKGVWNTIMDFGFNCESLNLRQCSNAIYYVVSESLLPTKKSLKEEAKDIYSHLQGYYTIGIQIRTGIYADFSRDLKDYLFQRIPGDYFVERAMAYTYKPNTKWLIISDSLKVKQFFMSHYPNITVYINHRVTHFTPKTTLNSKQFSWSLVENELLSLCDMIIRTPISSFGHFAAILNTNDRTN
ncbi:hypothetical protein WA158_002485 [Blastocystis sp. Blastoise]